jgi:predicted ATP-grasp superfamily ATP-dependent carboligase
MNKEEFENIVNELGDLKNLPNSKLIEIMDKLTNDFDLTKNSIIGLTVYLDSVEELYNKTLKEYQSRT